MDAKTDAFLLRLFEPATNCGKPKGDTPSGSDFVESLIKKMSAASAGVQKKLAESHSE